jgi:hypothetical protein
MNEPTFGHERLGVDRLSIDYVVVCRSQLDGS